MKPIIYLQLFALLGIIASTSVLHSQTVTAFTFDGDASYDEFGRSVSSAGDVNGDGFSDLIVGAWANDTNGMDSGLARVYSGLNGSVLYALNGDSPGDRFGYAVSGAGDVNGDGFDDFVISAPIDGNNGVHSGSVRVFSGIDGSILYTLNGDSPGDQFGFSASGAGDINGDGFDDFVVGAPGASINGSNSGTVRVVSGVNGSTLHTFDGDSAADRLGWSVSGAGDVNGDGFDDVIAGAYEDDNNGSNSGSARVISGLDGSVLHTFNGSTADDFFGYSVDGAGDVNGDGFDDLIIGAWSDENGSNSGSAIIFSGVDGSVLSAFFGTTASSWFGISVSGAGDVNGDGFSDTIVGAHGQFSNASNSGRVRVFSGFDGSTLATFDGDSAFDYFGSSVNSAGDVNGDGVPDVIVGATGDDPNGSNSGSARVFLFPPQYNGQSNSANARLEVNGVSTGTTTGPFTSPVTRGQYFTLDFSGAPNSFYEAYASYILNPGGWDFGPFGLFDLGTGPTFADCFFLLPGFQGTFPFYALDATGQSQLSFYVHPALQVGPVLNIQALIQNPQPWTNGHWGTLTAAHVLVIQ